jgi:hypothetical protein
MGFKPVAMEKAAEKFKKLFHSLTINAFYFHKGILYFCISKKLKRYVISRDRLY